MKPNIRSKPVDKASVSVNYFLSIFFLSLITIVVEYYISYLIFLDKIGLTTYFISHLVISALLLMICLIVQAFKIDKRLFLYLFFLTLVVGILGSIICFFTSIICWIFYRNADLNWLFNINLQDQESENEKLYYRLIASQEDFSDKRNLTSLAEIMDGGTTHQKRLVIAKIAKYFSPNLAQLLRQAVSNKENSIRVQAATIIANIESTFSKKLIELKLALKKEPKNTELLHQLAQHYDAYAYCGILTDKLHINKFYNQAIKHYIAYQKQSNDDSAQIALTLGRLYIRTDQNKNALKQLDIVLAKQENDNISPQFFLWYLEVLYRLQQYVKLVEFCLSYKNKIAGNAAAELMAMEAIELWTTSYAIN